MVAGMMLRSSILIALTAALISGGCKRTPEQNDLSAMDQQLVRSAGDPAVNSALNDPILTDPALTQQSNSNAVRPPERPIQAQYPEGSNPGAPPCGRHFAYGSQWAAALLPPFAIYPGARLTEAAADNSNGCALHVATFLTPDPPGRVMDWYQGRAGAAGYSASREDRGADLILAGSKGDDGPVFFLMASPSGSGSDVSLIIDGGN